MQSDNVLIVRVYPHGLHSLLEFEINHINHVIIAHTFNSSLSCHRNVLNRSSTGRMGLYMYIPYQTWKDKEKQWELITILCVMFYSLRVNFVINYIG